MNTMTLFFFFTCMILAVGGRIIHSDSTLQQQMEEKVKEAAVWREKFDREVMIPAKNAAENGIETEKEENRLMGLPNIPQLSQADDMLMHQTFSQLKQDMETLDSLTNALKKKKPGK